jgi:cardiolipin synthase
MYETIIAVAVASYGILTGFHALLNKRDPRSTIGWVTMCALLPVIGATMYWVLGVNRLRTQAREWQAGGRFTLETYRTYADVEADLSAVHPSRARRMTALSNIAKRVTRKPLLLGNKVDVLYNGEQAYPAMLEAIGNAEKSVCLCTYLFDTDEAGQRFIDVLGATAARGVDVRVLVDALGERYSRPRASKLLRRREGVKVARFLPLGFSRRALRFNLRNHRKLLIVDNEVAFTGGMNIGQRHMVEDDDNKHKTADMHFRFTGPAIYELEEMFWEDWHFATGEEPTFDPHESIPEAGQALCRGIPDGPNEDFEVLTWILVGALSVAEERVQIMTPYFIPSRELLSALNAAALRGVRVDIILPSKNNLPFVAWAAQAMMWEVIQHGVRVYYQPPPFNHSKLFVVDEFYTILGSANLDPRSLRLNFEFNMEVYDEALGKGLSQHFERIRVKSKLISKEELDERSVFVRFRDAVAKLTSPYL